MQNVLKNPTRLLDPILIPVDMHFNKAGVEKMHQHISDHHATNIDLLFFYNLNLALRKKTGFIKTQTLRN